MKGRKTFSPEIEKAAEFISTEFNSIGLISYQQNGTKSNSSGSYRQEFALIRSKIISITAKLNEQAIEKIILSFLPASLILKLTRVQDI